jgi:hypothetical protein
VKQDIVGLFLQKWIQMLGVYTQMSPFMDKLCVRKVTGMRRQPIQQPHDLGM